MEQTKKRSPASGRTGANRPPNTALIAEDETPDGNGEVKEVSLKKFKSVAALIDAYNSLEAEYAGQSRKLRELERKTAEADDCGGAERHESSEEKSGRRGIEGHENRIKTDGQDADAERVPAESTDAEKGTSSDGENGTEKNTGGGSVETVGENADGNRDRAGVSGGIETHENVARGGYSDGEAARNERPDERLSRAVSEFVRSRPFAGAFAKEIAEELQNAGGNDNNDKFAVDENGLRTAYMRALERKCAETEKAARDENFWENYVYKNDAIRQKIISDYIDGLDVVKPPRLIGKGGGIPITPPSKPKSIAEAGRLTREMLKG
jgi:hypothetical protein